MLKLRLAKCEVLAPLLAAIPMRFDRIGTARNGPPEDVARRL